MEFIMGLNTNLLIINLTLIVLFFSLSVGVSFCLLSKDIKELKKYIKDLTKDGKDGKKL